MKINRNAVMHIDKAVRKFRDAVEAEAKRIASELHHDEATEDDVQAALAVIRVTTPQQGVSDGR